jgi:hypothetical protein
MTQAHTITATSIDTLGAILAHIADLTAEAEIIKAALKEAATASVDATNVFNGENFKATVVQADRTNVAYAKIVKDIGVAEDVIAKYATISAVFTVKVTSK